MTMCCYGVVNKLPIVILLNNPTGFLIFSKLTNGKTNKR